MDNKKQNNINLSSKTTFYDKTSNAIFSNTNVILAILGISLMFISYVIYIYYFKSTDYIIKSNSSYYGKDITFYEPIFKEQSSTINDCISMCENDITCDGITYNNNTKICTGTKDGQIRNENNDYSAWVKPKNKSEYVVGDFAKSVQVGYTKTFRLIDGTKINNPYMIGNFTYSFNLTIYDFYKNYGSWRHIFHKGTPITPGTVLSYQSWENLIKDIPNQCIGVWLAPFNNNLRIAITTTSLGNRTYGSYSDAFTQKCNDQGDCFITDMPSGKWNDNSRASDGSNPKTTIETNLEFFDQDLQNIPINKQLNITINLQNNIAEVYFNGKIVKIVQLDGTPKSDKSNLYVLNDKTANCEISNLIVYPDNVKLIDIDKIMSLAPPIL
jgi:hypothetical protein